MSSKLWTEEQFNCPVCLELPSEPATLPCGHSYCMACIQDFWRKEEAKGVFSCPQCRQTFSPRPKLSRNTMLAEAVEQLRTSSADSSPSASSSWSATVPCDLCTTGAGGGGERRAAVRSCLVCMSSYCQAHLKPHQSKKSLKEHELIAPTADLPSKICAQHKYLQEFFCRQCQLFVCWICTSNQHKGHQCVSTKAQRIDKQKVMLEQQAEIQQKLKEKEQELKDMKTMMDGMKRSAERVQTETEEELEELRRSVERLAELLEEALERAQQEKLGAAQQQLEALQSQHKRLLGAQQQIKELARCEDHIHFLQNCEPLCSPLEAGDFTAVQVNLEASLEPVRDTVLDLRERVEDMCNQELARITKLINEVTLFTLGDANRGLSTKAGLLKLFSSLGPRSTGSASPGGSAGSRSAERRAPGLKSQDVRSRDTPRANRGHTNSPRLRDRRSEDRATVRESPPVPSPAPSPAPVPAPSPTPAPRASHSLWSRSSQNPVVPAPAPALAPAPAATTGASSSSSSSGFSRMASIGSLFRSHRRGNSAAQSADTRSMSSVPESPIEVNPALFLDSPTQTPAFPALREINIDSIQAPEPRSREEFLQYCVTLTLDPDTAHRQLLLSEGDTKATLQTAPQACADSPRRFDGWTQVMSRQPLPAARCYWEVEWRGRGSSVGVAYASLARKGSEAGAGLGYNAHSWALELSDAGAAATHHGRRTETAAGYAPRLGVYADGAGGTLAFYAVAESMTHLHTFRARFSQPLYAVLGVGGAPGAAGLDFALGRFSSTSDSVKICAL